MAGLGRTEEQYYKKIAAIQESMYTREKRRLELERELFAYSRSDTRILQIKYSKLHSYLKEICDRGAGAKMRNLELQRDVECIEISMKEYSPDRGPLQQQKANFIKKVFRYIEAKDTVEPEIEITKVEAVQRRQWDGHISHPARDFTPSPVEIFMDRQTSRGSDTEACTTSVHSHQALHRSPNRCVHSRERLPSGLLKDFRVGGEDVASKRAHLSDDISGSNDSPDGCNLSDKHERMMGLLPSVRALTGAAGSVASGSDDEQEASPLVTLTRSEKNPSPGNSSHMTAKNSLAEHTDSQEVAREPLIMGDEQRGRGHLMPETTFGKEAQETSGKCESVSGPSFEEQLPESSASDLTISLTQSETEEDLPEDVAAKRNASDGGSGDQKQHSPDPSAHSDGDSSAPVVTSESLSLEGLFNLLDSIEGRLHGEQTCVYRDSSIEQRQLNRIISPDPWAQPRAPWQCLTAFHILGSLCDDGVGLTDEDLEACGAVVLRNLQGLSWSTETGGVLSQDLVNVHQYSTEPNEIRTSLPPNAARLWDRWFKHALVLKERRVLATEHLVQLFTPLLLQRHATYCQQAKVLLRTLLSRSSEECPSAEDESDISSLCHPPLLTGKDVSTNRSIQRPQIQELQSTEEDSQDESPVESGPIRETKAYQLLKQSAMQERLPSSEEEEEEQIGLSGINRVHEEDLGRAKRSSHQDPYPRSENSKAFSALQPKALWQESDDSNSEIEAAVRPPAFNTDNHDVEDFYD